MLPLQIDAGPGRRLAAMFHAPPARANGRAVLVINPLGQEAVRAHRLLRVLSERLARQGVHVLRFDFHGCGDSSGDDRDGEMEGWQGDLMAAHAWLQQQPGVNGVAWLGIRLGFAVGWQAACAMNQGNEQRAWPGGRILGEMVPPDRLIGWDPVAAGRAYLDRLWADHQLALKRAFSLPTIPDRQLRRQRTERDLSEAMGFALSSRLVAQIRELDRQDWSKPPLAQVNVLLSKGALPWPDIIKPASAVTQAAAMRAAGRAPTVHLEWVDVDFDWTSEEALNTPLVPDLALRRLLPWLSEDQQHA